MPRCGVLLVSTIMLALGRTPVAAAQEPLFVRGDVDRDGALNITDAIRIFGFLFLGNPRSLDCEDAADVDDSGDLNITDGIFLLSFLFSSGRPPPPPTPSGAGFAEEDCGPDPGPPDALGCESFPLCEVEEVPLTAAFSADPLSGPPPLQVVFDASASSGPAPVVRHEWNFGDGEGGSGVTARHVFETLGEFVVTLAVTDANGDRATASRRILVTGASAFLSRSSPADGEVGVAVARESILEFSAPIDDRTVTPDSIFAEFGGERLAARLHVSPDRRKVTLFYVEPLPASATIRLHVLGDLLRDETGGPADADADGVPGGEAAIDFRTLTLTSVAGTSVCGRVFASELAPGPGGGSINVPLAGVTITVEGIDPAELSAVTDAMGDFRLEPAPAGRFFVEIDGRTAARPGADGGYYPFVGKTFEAVAGEETSAGSVFLPLIREGTLQDLAADADTVITLPQTVLADFPELAGVVLRVPPGSLFSDDGGRGGKVGIAPVPPDRLPGKLPPGLDPAMVITVQTDGATNFDEPVPVCFPNLPDPATGRVLEPGEASALWSFNHDSGQWEVVASMTVTEDGTQICTDPGQGILAPGWHGTSTGTGGEGGRVVKSKKRKRREPCAETDDRALTRTETQARMEEAAAADALEGEDDQDADAVAARDRECQGGQEPKHGDCNGDATCSYGCKVYLHSGEEHFSRVDLVIPGRGDIDFVMQRSYRSRLDYNGPLGHGWDFGYNESLFARPNGDVVRSSGAGYVDAWRAKEGGRNGEDGVGERRFAAPPGDFRDLLREPSGSYVLRSPTGFKRRYRPDGRLEALIDRNGNTMVFEYDDRGNLDLVIDAYGREIDFVFEAFPDGADRLVMIRDFIGREVRYTYDGNGDLVAVRGPAVTGTSTGNDFPDGKTERYTYSSGFALAALNHNLTSVTYPEEVALGGPPAIEWVYGTDPGDPLTFDRVLEERLGGGEKNASGVPAGGTTRFSYELLNQDVPPGNLRVPRGKATIIERNGNTFEYFVNELKHHILRRRLTRGLREGEPDFYETESFFDADGQLIRRIFPAGNEIRYTYDTAGPRSAQQNAVEIRRIAGPRGGDGAGSPTEDLVTTMTYEPLYNRVASITDPRGNAAGFVPPIGEASAERYTTRFFFDYQEGSDPIPDVERFGIDISGVERGLGDLNGDGRTDQTAGNVVRRLDPGVLLEEGSREAARLGAGVQRIITETQWNDRGQMTRVIDPEGNVTVYDYYPEIDPDGDGAETFTLFRMLSEEPSGYLRSVTADAADSPRRSEAAPPAALETVFRHDGVGNVIASRDPRGVVTAIEVNQLDQPVVVTRGAEIDVAVERGELITGEEPFRYRTRVFYDRNNRIVRREIENRDGPPGDPDPAGLGEFVEHTVTYDILDNPVESTVEVDADTVLVWRYRYDENELRTRVIQPEGNILAIEYDERNLPFRITRGFGSPAASTIRIDYDLNANETRRVDAEDNDGDGEPEEARIIYDGFDRPVEAIDRMGNRFLRSYDVASNVVRRRTFGHPPGRPGAPEVRLEDELYSVDELQRTYRIDEELFVSEGFAPLRPPELQDGNADGFVTTIQEYDALSRPTFTVEDDGEVTATVYDGAGRIVERADFLGNRLVTEYDQNSNPISTTSIEVSPDGLVPDEVFTTTYVWDQLDRLVRVTDNAGQTTRFAYDSRDNLVRWTDPVGPPAADPLGLFPTPGRFGAGEARINAPGNSTTYIFDGFDREIRRIQDLRAGGAGDGAIDTSNPENPDGRIELTSVWDGNSRLAARIDDNGNRTSFGYDELDRQVSQVNADGTRWEYVHDRDDNVRRVTDPNGTVSVRTYDVLDRLVRTEVTRAAGVEGTTLATYEYDGLDRMTRSTDDNGDESRTQVCEYVYDSLSRVLEERFNGRPVSNVYSGDSKRLACTYPGGRRISTSFDSIDRPQRVFDAAGEISRSAFVGPGMRELERRLGNGTRLSHLDDAGKADIGYDAVQRAVRERCLLPDGLTAFVDRGYSYNRASVRTSETRLDDQGLTDRYTFDSVYRVIESAFDRDGPPGADRRDIETIRYVHDGAGNRRSQTVVSASRGESVIAHSTNEMNEYTERGGIERVHSDNGNLRDDGSRSFVYDYRNRLVSVADLASGRPIAEYLYYEDNRRAVKRVFSAAEAGAVESEFRYFYDGSDVCEEQDAGGETRITYVTMGNAIDEICQYERGPAHPLGPGRLWTHQNVRGDVVAVTDAAGAVVEKTVYDDFGAPSSASTAGNPYLFQGRRLDPETGLYYFRNRYYDPRTGRFLQRDPVWDEENSGNQYAFAGNDAVTGTDPFGLKGGKKNGRGRKRGSRRKRPAVRRKVRTAEEERQIIMKAQLGQYGLKPPKYTGNPRVDAISEWLVMRKLQKIVDDQHTTMKCTGKASDLAAAFQGIRWKYWGVTKWRWRSLPGVFEHSAVVVFRKGDAPCNGWVFDNWWGSTGLPGGPGSIYKKSKRPGGYPYTQLKDVVDNTDVKRATDEWVRAHAAGRKARRAASRRSARRRARSPRVTPQMRAAAEADVERLLREAGERVRRDRLRRAGISIHVTRGGRTVRRSCGRIEP